MGSRLSLCFEFLRESRDKHLYQCASNTCQGPTDMRRSDNSVFSHFLVPNSDFFVIISLEFALQYVKDISFII